MPSETLSNNTKDIVQVLENGQRERRHVTYLRTLSQARKTIADLYPAKDATWRENLSRMISYIGVRDAVDPKEGGSYLFNADRWFGLVRNLGYPDTTLLDAYAEEIRTSFIQALDPTTLPPLQQ